MGSTGRVGGAVAKYLLAAGLPVRVIVRNGAAGTIWARRGCEVAEVASARDTAGLARAFKGARGVFLINPPNYDPEPGFPDTISVAVSLAEALDSARPDGAVFLSSIGAHIEEFNLLNNAGIVEAVLRGSDTPVTMLRPAWFMENAGSDVEAARSGSIPSYLQPLDHNIAMVAAKDIGAAAATLLQETWGGVRIVELEGPRRYSADDIASTFSTVMGRAVETTAVPRESWETLFRKQGMKHPDARMRMLDGFNEGWLDFEGDAAERRAGNRALVDVIIELAES